MRNLDSSTRLTLGRALSLATLTLTVGLLSAACQEATNPTAQDKAEQTIPLALLQSPPKV